MPKPFVKWAGGKTQLLPQLLKLIPTNFNNYFEPFIGGGALFFALADRLKNKHAYINDINAALIGVYQNIQKNSQTLLASLQKLENEYHQKDKTAQQEFYYEIRNKYNDTKLQSNDLKKSLYFLFLNKTGYNGMYRENSKGEFNIPFGKYNNPTICDSENLRAIAKLLTDTIILNTSFQEAVADAQAGDLIYFDPPYYPLTKTASFTSYHETGFLEKEQQLLKQTFTELDKRGCYVILSNSYALFIRDLYQEYTQLTVQASRFINSKAAGRGKINEIIITNF
jgi:DNA adenine methylase